MKIGIIGCGKISGIYIQNLTSGRWPWVELSAVADLDKERARGSVADRPGIRVLTVEELLSDPEIGLVLNLTVPQAHYPVGVQAVRAGKHHYSEKPMALDTVEAGQLVKEAAAQGVRLGCAPDTFMGAGIQTAVRAIEDGLIGKPVGVMGYVIGRGHESWHPSPEFYYQKGGGPLMDMGPYYLTAMVAMLGRVREVKALRGKAFETRTITSQPRAGTTIPVEVDTHLTALLDFECGAAGMLVTSFDAVSPGLPPLVITGTEGALKVPDPNTFGGEVVLIARDRSERVLAHVNDHTGNLRGLGVADMALAIEEGRTHAANDKLAGHVLEVMEKILRD